MENRDTLGALRDCNLAIAINPKDAWAWIKDCTGFTTEAIVDYHYAIQINPNYKLPWYNLGELRLKLGLYKEAIDDLGHFLAIDSLYLLAYEMRAAAKCNLNFYKEATSDYDKAIKIAPPNYSYLYMGRGLVKYRAGLLKDALSDYDRAIKIEAGHTDYYYRRAALNMELKNYKQVITDCKNITWYDKNIYNSYTHFSNMLFEMDRKDEALKMLDKLVKKMPKRADVYMARALIKQKMFKQQDAEKDLETAVRLSPRATDGWYQSSAENNFTLHLFKQVVADCDKGLAFNAANKRLTELKILALKQLGN